MDLTKHVSLRIVWLPFVLTVLFINFVEVSLHFWRHFSQGLSLAWRRAMSYQYFRVEIDSMFESDERIGELADADHGVS
jgi:hypothetical protein